MKSMFFLAFVFSSGVGEPEVVGMSYDSYEEESECLVHAASMNVQFGGDKLKAVCLEVPPNNNKED